MTQCDKVLKYINDFGSITPLEAMNDLGIMRLAARINDLSNKGIAINREMVKSKNRYGETVHYAKYSLAA